MKIYFAFLVTLFLLAGCSNQAPTPYPTIEPTPTLSTGYQVVGSTKNTFMVVVDPKDNTNREGLQSIGKRLCQSTIRCKVWFWDDISKADTAYPVDPDKEELLIAVYSSDLSAQTSELKVFTLGDER